MNPICNWKPIQQIGTKQGFNLTIVFLLTELVMDINIESFMPQLSFNQQNIISLLQNSPVH